jgi:Protein of unknown function (DUF3987)
MYRGGKGSDRQQWLTLWDGSEIKVNRKSGVIYVPQVSLSIVGGIQPQTIRNMINGDDSNLDGLWHRFSFVALPDTSLDPFTELSAGGCLTTELDKIYTALTEQEHQTYWLALDAKPIWSKWHYEMESKRLNCSHEMTRGIYPKFRGIAARNALILHCTYAAISGTVPDQLIPASTVETAILWTEWELSQTLLQYQLLGLTDDPELSRILKFIDKFTGKDWVSAADVRSWWSVKPKPNVDELKKFMAKVVSLGHAIDNDAPIDSSKYRIQILVESSRSSRKNPESQSQQQESERLSVVAKFKTEKTESSHSNGSSTATTDSRSVNGKYTNGYSDFATTSTTFSKDSDLKIGSSYLLDGDRTITLVSLDKDGIIANESESVLYLPFDLISSLVPIGSDKPTTQPNGKIERIQQDNGMVEVVRKPFIPAATEEDGY